MAEEQFTGTETGTVTDIFIPMAMKNARTLASLNNFWLRTLVQLKPGVAAEPVREKLRATFRALQEERAASFPTSDRNGIGSTSSRRLVVGARGGGPLEHAARLPAGRWLPWACWWRWCC